MTTDPFKNPLMKTDPFKNPMKNPFVGTWTVLAKEKRWNKEIKTKPKFNTVKISLRTSREDRFYMLRFYEGSARVRSDWHLATDSSSNTIRGVHGKFAIRISFWRASSYDVIFALREDQNKSIEIWSAKRDHDSAGDEPPPHCDSLITTDWDIALTTGFHGASGRVKLRRLVGTEGESPTLPIAQTGLFGLFNRKSETDDWKLYDILAYDETVRSYNSVFGVRSLNHYWSEDHQQCRVFATFNNKSSIPATHFPSPAPLYNHRIGRLMSFELSDPDSDDPDVGTWVGEPG